MKFQIKHRITKTVLYESEAATLKECVVKGVDCDADLRDADLGGAYLSDAYLGGADLGGADLRDAYLRGAYLGDASLSDASLSGAYLRGADLRGAYLCDADLCDADLRGADLRGAYLGDASLSGAYLRGAVGYQDSHQIFFELIRREKIENLTEKEWSIIGLISIHLPCWDTIKKRFGKDILPLFQRLADEGFNEYLDKYEQVLNK